MSELSTILGGIGIDPEVVVLDDFVRGQLVVLVLIAHVDQVLGLIDRDFSVVGRELKAGQFRHSRCNYPK